MSIRLVLAEDHELIRAGIVNLLTTTEIEVVGQTVEGPAALRLARELRPDVMLLDVRLEGSDGLVLLGQLRSELPDVPVLMLSTYDNPTFMARAYALGACGYLLKGCTRQALLDAIRTAARKEVVWSREELRRVTGALATPRLAGDLDISLTTRESEVLRQLALGLSNKEIAQALGISYETVKEHVQHILRKIGVSDRTQAAVWAVRRGLA